jgi:hypothetical protein
MRPSSGAEDTRGEKHLGRTCPSSQNSLVAMTALDLL